MKKVELLAPAGSFEALEAAIAAGCDAIYLGGSGFGARAFAKNFSDEQMVEAIKFAHLYDVKVYVTLNTLIYDYEFKDVIKYINFLYNNDVDAIIVQDIGLMQYVTTNFPDLEIHASTQMSIHNLAGVHFLKEQNVQRVVLARENTLEDIKKITPFMETEVFVHGALCVSYSGQCLMSSLIGGRSGNRGRCAQPCRKLYRLSRGSEVYENKKYLLSPKDLNTVEHIGNLIEAGVHSLKIEGRMKSPEYVAIVVSSYRKAIDNYYKDKKTNITQKDLADLAQIFNREFTKGFMFGAFGNDYINLKKNNNRGVKCGEVISSDKHTVTVKLVRDLYLNDGIYFDDTTFGMKVSKIIKSKKEAPSANIGDTVTLPVKQTVAKGVSVYKTTDVKLLEEAKEKISNRKQLPLSASIELYINKNPKLILQDLNENKVIKELDFIIEKSKDQPIEEEKISNQLNKLGNTPFYLTKLNINKDDNIFIPMGALNQLRRDAIDELIQIRQNKHNRNKKNIVYSYDEANMETISSEDQLIVYCRTLDQVKAARDLNIQTIYVDEEIFKKLDHTDDVYLTTSRINYQSMEKEESKGFVVSDLGSLHTFKDEDIVVSNVNLNIVNSESIKLLKSLGVDYITLSYELNESTYKKLNRKDKSNLEIIIYGYQESMITKHCFFASDCKKQCKKGHFNLTDELNEDFPVFMDDDCHMHILNSKKLILGSEIKTLQSYGYQRFRLQLSIENYEETYDVIKAYDELVNARNDKMVVELIEKNKQMSKFTRGYFTKDIL